MTTLKLPSKLRSSGRSALLEEAFAKSGEENARCWLIISRRKSQKRKLFKDKQHKREDQWCVYGEKEKGYIFIFNYLFLIVQEE